MKSSSAAMLGVVLLAGCAAPPLGPLVRVLPGPDKSYAQFSGDDDQCRAAAQGRVAGQAQYINDRAVGAGVLSTVVGAGLGAVLGGGRGAAVGAATGAGLGVGLGAGSSADAQGGIQFQYDSAYAQCMVAHGDQVPGFAPPAPAIAYAPVPVPMPIPVPVAVPEPVGYTGSIRNPMVRDIQRQLRRHGFYPGATDGIDSPETAAAIQSFEASHNLPPDGVASPYLLNVLRNTPPGNLSPVA